MDKQRFDRQIQLFGEEGQKKIECARVAIVGLGGLGSHVAQQLAYLGVKAFCLVDGDTVEASNLNRLIGAVPDDVAEKAKKVAVAERTVKAISPSARVQTHMDFFVSAEGFERLQAADVVVGAMDNDGSRFILNELCQIYDIPYLDLATDVDPESGVFGGRLLFSAGGNRCLVCEEEIDQGALDAAFATDGQRAEEEAIYGVPQEVLGEGGPAVVSVNGVVASLGVTELLMHITGYRPVNSFLVYDGRAVPYGGLRFEPEPKEKSCYYCDALQGSRDRARLERYLSDGTAERLRGRLNGV